MISGKYYTVSGRKGSRNRDSNKYLRDAEVLEKAHAETLKTCDPLHLRYAFYCANSYADAQNHEKAIQWYKTTLLQNNWCQEKYIACFRTYECCEVLKQKEKGFFYLVQSFLYDNERVECLVPLITHYLCNDMPDVAYNYYRIVKPFFEERYLKEGVTGKLFVDVAKYNLILPYYMILVADKVKEFNTVLKMYQIIFEKKTQRF